jgi:hypothetical protein
MSGLAPVCFTMDDVAEAVWRSPRTEVKYRAFHLKEGKRQEQMGGMMNDERL